METRSQLIETCIQLMEMRIQVMVTCRQVMVMHSHFMLRYNNIGVMTLLAYQTHLYKKV